MFYCRVHSFRCMSKGKEHKKYEFGSKVSIITTKNSGVIIGAINIEKNVHDSKTLEPSLAQQQRLTGIILKNNFVDRGFSGVKEVLRTKSLSLIHRARTGQHTKNKNYAKDLSEEQL